MENEQEERERQADASASLGSVDAAPIEAAATIPQGEGPAAETGDDPASRAKKEKKKIKKEKKEAKEPMPSAVKPTPEPVSSFSFPNLQKIALYLFILLGILLVYNVYTLWQTSSLLDTKIAEAKSAAIPLDISVTLITPAECDACADITDVLDDIKLLNVKVTEETALESNGEEAQALFEEYAIATVPAIIIIANEEQVQNKSDVVQQLETTTKAVSGNEFVYQSTTPPYYDIASEQIKGLVTIISITAPDCEECQDISSMIPALEQALTVQEVKEYAYGSEEAQEYMEKYDLQFVPTFIISADAAAYNGFAGAWVSYGTEEDDGSFIFRNTIPPYLNATTGEVIGLVDVIYLTDESCADCYNVTIHENILNGFGIVFDEETTVDISSEQGETLLEKYKITKVPTVILSKDAAEYSSLAQIWSQVGSIAEDGSYIFTNMDQMKGAVYTNLEEANETAE